ncbi:undecaprenyldiphospho-muramoylpentapeptide beta-N-acetylglucosaminyltransferase [Thiomicrospira sp. ALE5]|uniref:undecaprenyldiphospho-muramoylpentapeptide beta-N-acetylglucosaminyltransferase n=1 Tax=Thiomicrospira sp. ALE5 TaxID=748650 RepID=UPI0008E8F88E|nr:undecaprenyldiphospho-muramoylpentapeptide beta-N-acetylglucosaminyltransferase [Thiomicrospira sp. ALE5]SFR60792.1 UDP-N-acetylglucosamine-N-acetylmuramylpentapeptide N-acetylglucosamine transferase [Thiomicrospira sp. ALE5]
MNKPNRIMIMAAGTGGHVFPGLALAEAWQAQGVEVVWLGTPNGMEKQWVSDKHIPFYAIDVKGLRGNGLRGWVSAPWRLSQACWRAYRLIRQLQPDAVLGMGGFVCGPGGLAAKLAGLPLYLHEQNAIVGLTNRLLAPLAKTVFCGFQVRGWHAKNQYLVGNPVREAIQKVPALTAEQTHSTVRKILVIGGSRGARALNETLPQALGLMAVEQRPEVLHQTGQAEQAKTCAAYEACGVSNVKVVSFIDNMAQAYAECDLVIARAGALTVSEVQAAKRPAIFIPFPYAVDDHQSANADVLVQQGVAQTIVQTALTPDGLAKEIQHWLDTQQRFDVSNQFANMPQQHATEQVLIAIKQDFTR